MRRLATLVLAFLSMPAWATTYYFAGGPYSIVANHTTCGTGACADYAAASRVTGSFTTALPLAGNLPATEISGLITSYSFSDGVNTYASAVANARISRFKIQTNAAGTPIFPDIALQLWQAAAPHAGGDRFDMAVITTFSSAVTNATCNTVGASPDSGVADTCTAYAPATTDTSYAAAPIASTWSVDVPIVVPPNVPTTYYFASGPYTTRFPHATCGTGACADYPLASRITGSFTTALALPPGLPATEISGLITSYSFSDGVHTYASADANARVNLFQVQTDASGLPAPQFVLIQQWQAAGPHNAGNNRFNLFQLSTPAAAGTNVSCTAFGTAPSGAADACTAFIGSSDTSQAISLLSTRTAIGAPPSLALSPTTYAFASTPYGSVVNHTTCAVGACADYLTSMRLAGSVTLVDRLPANANLADVSGLVSAYGFSDGVNSISGANPNARIIGFTVQTDGAGVPSSAQLALEQWQGAGPHGTGDRLDLIGILGGSGGSAVTNALCPAAAAQSPLTGAPDVCISPTTSTDSSLAFASNGGAWSIARVGPGGGQGSAAPVPVLTPWMLAALSIALVAAGIGTARRRTR